MIVDLVPNQKTTLGISVQYDIISFSFGIAPKIFAENKDNEGSKMTFFGFSIFPGKWMQRFDYYYQKGLSLETEGIVDYLPELRTMKIGGSTSYVFNKNFSFKALAFQNEKQLRSAGSFVPELSYYYTELNGKKVEEMGSKASFINVALSPGYHYNWVIAKKFLVAGGISLGAGFTRVTDGITYTEFLTTSSLSLALGYNSDTFYGGIYLKGIVSSHIDESKVGMDDSVSYSTAFFGYRFNAPSVLEREKEKVKKKIKL